jgi:epoxyqueuosine reductase
VSVLCLHICCAPDATVAFERLIDKWKILAYFNNPNIEPVLEYEHREAEVVRLSNHFNIEYFESDRNVNPWIQAIEGFEGEREGGKRCERCITHRLDETARFAKENSAEAFATTLTTSPHKNVNFIHEIGETLQEKYGVIYLAETFRKNNGFKRSIDMCAELGVYRQNYCGCRWSLPVMRTVREDNIKL